MLQLNGHSYSSTLANEYLDLGKGSVHVLLDVLQQVEVLSL